MKNFRLDFETRSEADIKKVGAWRYAEDKSTDILCFAYRIDEGPVKLWTPSSEDPIDLFKIILSKDFIFRAHNAEFETAIWFHQLYLKRGWPMLPFTAARCTAAKAAAMGLPRKLDEVGAALRLPIQKDKEGSRIMLKLSKPRKPTKLNPDKWHNDPADFLRLYQYCITDVEAEESIDKTLPDLTPQELEIFLLDQKINRRGIFLDLESVRAALSFCDEYSKDLNFELSELTDGRILTSGQAAKIIEELSRYDVIIPDVTKETIAEALKRHGLHPKAKRILEIRQALALASTKKLNSMMGMAGADSRARGTMLYHGAATGRWAGRLLQIQNFPRGNLKEDKINRVFELLKTDFKTFRAEFPDVLSAISSALRGMLAAAPGKKLVAADFSAIEARVIFWLAGCKRGISEYELYDQGKGPEVYCLMAQEIYGREIIKGRDNNERQLGKQVILAASYSMGKDKFRDTCLGYNMDVSVEMAEKAVNTYRETYHEVKAFWYDLERAAVSAVKNPGQVFTVGKIKYCAKGAYLFCKLPSGRNIAYYRPHFKMAKTSWGEDKLALHYWAVNSQTRKFEPVPTYGGKLAENCFGGDSLILTDEGLVKIKDIKDQKIWDGVEFVNHGGIICKGEKEVMQWRGIQVTRDHKILTRAGQWAPVLDIHKKYIETAPVSYPYPVNANPGAAPYFDSLKRSTVPVYDILNCGPRSRFAVLTNQGAVLAHNCTQAVARDLMAHALKNVEKAGYDLIMSVHDEAVAEVDKEFGSAKEFAKIMTIKPEWAAGLPIQAEGWEGPRFKK